MLCTKSRPSLLLPTFFLVFSTFFALSRASLSYHVPTKPNPGVMGGSKYGVVSDGMRRSVVEGVYVKAMKTRLWC
ncbi:hypothetical protein QQP08_020310 [Theobroma cacao]|nr:hypothetical protein QQP08_020310 [Theobroma cacao]